MTDDEKIVRDIFGPPNPPGSTVQHVHEIADRREADERAQRREVCEACGRTWRHALALGRGEHTRRQADGLFWHDSCFARRIR